VFDSVAIAQRAACWGGFDLDGDQVSQLETYAAWLREEAIEAGGLGPREATRLWGRHLADSLTFAAGWREGAPAEILDVGTGVGLPGLPLAILWPETVITLLDRGGRRIRLLHRVLRILALPNVVIAQGDVFTVADAWRGMVFRGAVRAPEAVGLAARILVPGGSAVLGLSRRPELPERAGDLVSIAEALGLQAAVEGVPEKVLDGPAWLLIMRAGVQETLR